MILADWKESRTWVVSVRSSLLVLVLGMNVIVVFLGLLSLWQIGYFGFTMYKHYLLFLAGVENTKSDFRSHWQDYARVVDSPRNDERTLHQERAEPLLRGSTHAAPARPEGLSDFAADFYASASLASGPRASAPPGGFPANDRSQLYERLRTQRATFFE